jgi:toxin CcdB
MQKYDVFSDPRGSANLLVVVQADDFERFSTRLAIPLLPEHPRLQSLGKLNPVFGIDARNYILYTQHMLAVPKSALKAPVANLRRVRDQITAAIDFLMQGF